MSGADPMRRVEEWFLGQAGTRADFDWAFHRLLEMDVARKEPFKKRDEWIHPYLDKSLNFQLENAVQVVDEDGKKKEKAVDLTDPQLKFAGRLSEVDDLIRNHLPYRRWPDFLGQLVSVARIGLQHGDLGEASEHLAKLQKDVAQVASDLIQVYRITRMMVPAAGLVLGLGLALWFLPDSVLYAKKGITASAAELAAMGGVFGCLVSVMLRSRGEVADIRVDRSLLGWTTLLRPFLAASITTIAYLYVRTGVFVESKALDLTDPLITFLAGFLLGFNERFYTEDFLSVAVGRLSAGADK